LKVNGDDPEVIYKDRRPSQRYFANQSRLLAVSIALLIVIHSKGIEGFSGGTAKPPKDIFSSYTNVPPLVKGRHLPSDFSNDRSAG